MADYKDLCARLRERLITVPKPGSTAFEPLGAIDMVIGGSPYKPGDSAGLQSVSNYSVAGCSTVVGSAMPPWRVQAHIYAGEPLAYAAADAIEALQAQAEGTRKDAQHGWDAFYKLRSAIAKDKYPELTGVVRALAAQQQEADLRFGQPHYGHDEQDR